ncbi:MAG: 50S ribosomal protein L19 [Deltaproteobacteria bacterium GWA2_38_16]|nr:MAG: 50S ribosomal protein L19 [Deltaproteobacteria bacterium GWA2_38_16]OGQ03119.1 MAG: 50S ribosomal protein L19 [Deltaproteobacteria bacterium RIFCSPHIGHO2_02_FULL_38_15]OGQ33825.1 MAG: 50S ribosomal protein L19 [Deltaproteobacteria bacterium RIFCSPLOWO2_01_FULL_38_9]OGQ60198.1 MAG: 50S ribosomal protein L19 [Deltaproteobacteria bacterium RIFCSPLOWO2_12_FULL_38_8]HBQ20461.1 50S ribosomal protein L19 [Deltaproteobacteria bacterium]
MTEPKTKKQNLLEVFEQKQMRKNMPSLKVGDVVKVYAKIKEGDKERVQVYEGTICRYTKGQSRTSITVRKISFGVGVERVFPIYSPAVEKIERISEGKVRRARLYYLRQRRGKAARIESQWVESGEEVVETMGTVATGPVISPQPEGVEKKTAASMDVAEFQKN